MCGYVAGRGGRIATGYFQHELDVRRSGLTQHEPRKSAVRRFARLGERNAVFQVPDSSEYPSGAGLVVGAMAGLVVGAIAGLVVGSMAGLVVGLVVGLAAAQKPTAVNTSTMAMV